jgi:NAD(P)-dependent dehydrogenase (short-subunit alcohol dehydrogenase family)
MRLAGKTALIAGGTTGIGLAAARLMIAEGAKVAICGQEPERLREASTALGAQAKTYRADLRSLSDIRHLAKNVGDWTDQLDILFLNAGISRLAEFSSVDETFFEDHIAINVKGPFFILQHLLGLLGPNASVVMTMSCLDESRRDGTTRNVGIRCDKSRASIASTKFGCGIGRTRHPCQCRGSRTN